MKFLRKFGTICITEDGGKTKTKYLVETKTVEKEEFTSHRGGQRSSGVAAPFSRCFEASWAGEPYRKHSCWKDYVVLLPQEKPPDGGYLIWLYLAAGRETFETIYLFQERQRRMPICQ